MLVVQLCGGCGVLICGRLWVWQGDARALGMRIILCLCGSGELTHQDVKHVRAAPFSRHHLCCHLLFAFTATDVLLLKINGTADRATTILLTNSSKCLTLEHGFHVF